MNIKDGQIMDFTKHAAPVADHLLQSDVVEAVKAEAPTPARLESKVEVNNGIAAPPFFATAPSPKKADVELKKVEATEQMIQTHQSLLILDNTAPIAQDKLAYEFTPDVAQNIEESRLENAQSLMNALIDSRDKLISKKIQARLDMLNEQAELELTAALKGQINALTWVLKIIETSK